MTIVRAEIPATVWQVKVQVGDTVADGDELMVLESMKMEIPVDRAARRHGGRHQRGRRRPASRRATPSSSSADGGR